MTSKGRERSFDHCFRSDESVRVVVGTIDPELDVNQGLE